MKDIEEIRRAIHERQGGDSVFPAVVTEVDERSTLVRYGVTGRLTILM